MKYAFAGAALFAGAMAVPAWGETSTVEETVIATITSCGPEVTNCPASSTAAWSHPTGAWGPPGSWSSGSWSDSWSTSTPVSSAVPVTSSSSVILITPTPVISTSATWATSVASSTPVAPVSFSSSAVGTAPVVSPPKSTPVGTAPGSPKPSGTWTPPSGPVGTAPGGPIASGTAPGVPKPSGTGSWSSTSSSPVSPYTGGAAQNAAGLLAGVGAIAAFFL